MKRLFVTSAVAAATLTLAACGGSETTTTTSTDETTSPEEVVADDIHAEDPLGETAQDNMSSETMMGQEAATDDTADDGAMSGADAAAPEDQRQDGQ